MLTDKTTMPDVLGLSRDSLGTGSYLKHRDNVIYVYDEKKRKGQTRYLIGYLYRTGGQERVQI